MGLNSFEIACIIVTFNRKELLVRNINCLVKQEITADKIYIIDNASTDGTKDLLMEKGLFNLQVINYIKLKQNTGGAGGFFYGLKKAFEDGYKYYYMMDDDGQPQPTALKELLTASINYNLHYVNSIVLDDKMNGNLSFGLQFQNKSLKTLRDCKRYENKEGIIYNTANPINGLLLSNELVRKIGFPKKDMFIWGDETEYMLRAKSNGFEIATCINSIHYHPAKKIDYKAVFFGLFYVYDLGGMFRTYIKFRNLAYNVRKYEGDKYTKILMKEKIKYYYYCIVTRKCDIKLLRAFKLGIKHGVNDKFLDNDSIINILGISSIKD